MDQIRTGKLIASLRKEKGYTQEELGRRLGVSNKTVSRWENGNYMPDIETLRFLGKEFSVSMEELLDGERLSVKKPKKTPDPFTPKERADFWRRNWKQENKSWFVFWGIIVFLIAVFAFLSKHLLFVADFFLVLLLYLYFYNKMCIYVDNNAYKITEN